MQPVQLLTAFFVFAMSANLLHGRYRSAYALQQLFSAHLYPLLTGSQCRVLPSQV